MAAAFSAVAASYDEYYSTPADLADSEVIFRRARRLFRKGPPGILIDIGCGPGTALSWNVAGPDDYIGIDLAEGMIEEARRRWPPYSFVHGDHHAIQPQSATFILGGFCPIQYVHPRDRPEFARKVVDGLVPGGRFLVMARPHTVPTRIFDDDDLTWPASPDRLHTDFSRAGAVDVTVRGHRHVVPKTWPVAMQTWSLRAEQLFPLLVPASEYLVVEGRRPHGWYRRYA